MGRSKRKAHQRTTSTPKKINRRDVQPQQRVDNLDQYYHNFPAVQLIPGQANPMGLTAPRNTDEAIASYFFFLVNKLANQRPKSAQKHDQTGRFCCSLGGNSPRVGNSCGCIYTLRDVIKTKFKNVKSWGDLDDHPNQEDIEDLKNVFLTTATLLVTMLKLVNLPPSFGSVAISSWRLAS